MRINQYCGEDNNIRYWLGELRLPRKAACSAELQTVQLYLWQRCAENGEVLSSLVSQHRETQPLALQQAH